MSIRAACPKCRQTMTITQAPPVKVKCSSCGAVLSLNAPTGAKISSPSSPSVVLNPPGPPATSRSSPGAAVATPAGALRSGEAPVSVARGGTSAAPLVAAPRRASPSRRPWLIGGSALMLLLLVVGIWGLRGGGKTTGSGSEQSGEESADLVQPGANFVPGAAGGMSPRVATAVRKGIDYLKKRLTGPGYLYYYGDTHQPGIGAAALAGMTLLECDVPPDDEAIQQAIGHVQRNANRIQFTYTLALSILFLDRLCEHKKVPEASKKEYRDIIKNMALQMIAAQHRGGGWNYYCALMSAEERSGLQAQLQSGRFKPGSFKVVAEYKDYHDNSIAQFATLALWAARKHGVSVYETLVREEQRYREQQEDNGSWTYNERVLKGRDATTCAGLIGLAVGRGIRDEKNTPAGKQQDKQKQAKVDVKQDPAISKGLLYLAKVIGKQGNISAQEKARRHKHTGDLDALSRQFLEDRTGRRRDIELAKAKLDNDDLATGILFEADAWGDLYFLWSLERVAMVYDLQVISGKDWYNWGSEIILRNQESDGSWKERFPGAPDTCFALLFLKRINVVKDLTDKLRWLTAGLQLRAPANQGPPPPPPPGRREA